MLSTLAAKPKARPQPTCSWNNAKDCWAALPVCCTLQTDNKMLMKKQRQELAAAGAQAAYDAFKLREASRELDHVSHVLLSFNIE